MTLEIDSLLANRYRIVSELGRGGMGAVYRGRDENLGVDIAIKANLISQVEQERQFKREAKILASLRHPGLPRVTDYFVIPDQGQYLIMDYIEGDDAKSILEKSAEPLPTPAVVRWAADILEALVYLHTQPQPIIHRDIKPANIKISSDGRAILVDFGLAKIHDTKQSTTVGAKGLTPGYAPPEQYGLGRTDPRSDVYALGATLYGLLTKQVPVDGLERAISGKPLVPIHDLNPAVSPALAAVIEKAMAVKLEDRFPTASDFLEAINAATRSPDTVPAPVKHDSLADPSGSATLKAAGRSEDGGRRQGLIVAAAVIVVLLIVGGVIVGVPAILGLMPLPPRPTSAAVVLSTGTGDAPTKAPARTETAAIAETSTLVSTRISVSATVTPIAVGSPTATPRGGGPGQIAFVGERSNNTPQIFLTGPDGAAIQQLTTMADGACQPAWSPDGAQLLFISPCEGPADQYPEAQLYVMEVGGSGSPRLFLQPPDLLGAFDADWSASGVAFTYLAARPQIWVANADGGGARRVGPEVARDQYPVWSPDGKRLAFLRTSIPDPIILWAAADDLLGANPRGSTVAVTRPDQKATSPDWSPGGELIAYVVDDDIWVVPWDAKGFDNRQLSTTHNNVDPAFSPDGQWIAFTSWRDDRNYEIYLMKSDGTLQTRLTTDAGHDYQPAWRP